MGLDFPQKPIYLHKESVEARMVTKTRPKSVSGSKPIENPANEERALAVEHQAKIQRALYEIADAASAITEMGSFYRKLHRIVGKLMYARNFFVALYDEQSDLITWPYYVDTVDVNPPSPVSLMDQHGSTGWILRHAKTLADVDGSVAGAMKSGEIELVGTHSDGIGVPLKSEGKTIGVLIVQSYEASIKYTLQDMEILKFVAQHISTALSRARAMAETRQRNAELAIINSVQEGLASNLDIQSICTLVGDKLRDIFAADTTFIAFRKDAEVLHVAYYADRVLQRAFHRPYRTGIAELIIDSGRPLLLKSELEQQEHGALHIISPGAEKDLNQSVLGVPICRDGKSYGVVSVQSYKVNAFNENHLRLLQTLTNSMSVALENARLFAETQQSNAELQIINSVQKGLAARLEMQAIYELVGEKIRETFNAQVVSIATYDHTAQLMQGRYYFEDGKQQPGIAVPLFGFRKHVIETDEPMLIHKDMPHWMEKFANPVIQGFQPKSAIFIPMLVGEEALGVISLQNVDRENAFSQSDVRLLETLANSMSVALENARLWEQEKMHRKSLERELEIGREIQSGFLPKELPRVAGWEIAASLMPAREVAGDFYDAFELPDGNIGLVIADVCDKGVGAALFMTLFRSLIRVTSTQETFEYTRTASAPCCIADRLHHAISSTNSYIADNHGDSGMFATLFFGILDPLAGRLMYINGGHEPPLIVRSGNVRESLRKTGPAVGAIPGCHFDVQIVQLDPGDILFAFTDGAPEANDPRGEFFGHERLLQILRRCDPSSHELVRTIEAELHGYMDGATQFDDITLLAVRRMG